MTTLIDPAGRPLKFNKPVAPAAEAVTAETPAAAMPAAADNAGAALIKDSGIETFTADVLEASLKVPVIVDFWAPWCGPCKQLGPALEKAVTEAKGKVRLVKVNIDENPEIAQQLRIQSIPTVYAFFQGQPVDGFMGAIPESQVKTFVQTLIQAAARMPGAEAEEGGGEIAEVLALADDALAKRDLATAAQLFGQILQAEPGHPKAVAGLARCYLESGDVERAKNTLALVRPDGAADESIRAMQAEVTLRERAAQATPEAAAASSGPDTTSLSARIEANPADLQVRYDLALALDAKGQREAAIDQLLEIIKRERKWNEDAARQQLLTLFDAMGPADPRTLAARRRLSAILFS